MRTSLVLMLVGFAALQGCAPERQSPQPLQTTPATSGQPSVTTPSPTPLAVATTPPSAVDSAVSPAKPEPVKQAPAVPTSSSDVIARLSGRPITLQQLERPLLEGYGLNILLNLVYLEYTKQQAAIAKIVVTPDDVKNERELTFSLMFKDADKAEYEQLFTQLLQQQHISRAEFDLVIEANAYLRKMAEPLVKDKITDQTLDLAFRQLYGETIQVRHIELGNALKLAEVKRRLGSGEAFEKVAQEMSENARTGPLGGELPAFSRSANYPQVFKDVAFALKEGEVSDAVQMDGVYQIIKLEKRFAPKAVKFEDVKESLREDMQQGLVQQTMTQLRDQIKRDAMTALIIDQPVLKSQYDLAVRQATQQIQDHNQIKERLDLERERLSRAATQPSTTQPTTGPAILSAPSNLSAPSAPEVARPPAMRSGAAPVAPPDASATMPSLNK